MSEPEKIVTKFFDSYQENGPKNALRQLLRTNKYLSEQTSDSVATQLEKWARDFDDYQGYEIVNIKKYGNSMLFITCIVKYSKLPMRFNFSFYQPGNGWRLQNFDFKTEFVDELQ